MTILDFFIDPILSAPTWGCIFMGISTSLVGVMAFLKKRILIGETLSHVSYPGIILGILCANILPISGTFSFVLVMLCGFFSALLGSFVMQTMEEKFQVKSDASLCFILAFFFGLGILFASHIQFTHTSAYQMIQTYLYGQSATMTDIHIWIYGILALCIIGFIFLYYRALQILLFDKVYAKSLQIPVAILEKGIFFFLVLSIVVGTRSAGIVLVSGMLIAPVIAARAWTEKLSQLFFAAALISSICAFLGNYFSVVISQSYGKTLPTGPLIVVFGAVFALISLFLSPKRGFLFRVYRISVFKKKCLEENILKYIWKSQGQRCDFSSMKSFFRTFAFVLKICLMKMAKKKWLIYRNHSYLLTEGGKEKAAKIVRLHRLWELYLTSKLGMHRKNVHHSAEQMEHILTPDLEEKLLRILNHPKEDPHEQPIP